MTKRKEVRPLQVGERVRVYGNLKGGKEANGITATVAENSVEFGPGPGWITVAFTEDGVPFTKHVHPRQCVRLIKKPRPKPQERVVVWLKEEILNKLFSPGFAYWVDGTIFRDARAGHKRFAELRHGEIIVDRERLAKAYGTAFGESPGDPAEDRYAFQVMARCLGLEAK